MRQSKLFTKTRREAPKDEVSKNAELLIRAGFIHKEMAGVYSYLPLGLRVLNKIEKIIREEMNAIGGVELHLSALQDKKVWQESGRWDDAAVDNWFKTKLKNGSDLGLGFTHEEPLTAIMKGNINSFRDLPVYVYQFQTKFRNEERAKSGILRGREFLMKDLYSFSRDEAEHAKFYELVKQAYLKIFDRVGLKDYTYLTFASGGSFAKFSHEFQTLTGAGEDIIYVDEKKKIAVNKEVLTDEVLKDLGLKRAELVEHKSVEVGNIFNLGTRFSDALGLDYADEKGNMQKVVMGSYGIGLGRLMGTVAEVLSTSADSGKGAGLAWPESISPFDIHLVALPSKDGEVMMQAGKLYEALTARGLEVLCDDRDMRAGEKLNDSDLIGIAKRIVISEKTLANESAEVKARNQKEAKIVKLSQI